METAISLPFSLDPYGAILATTDQSKIWSDRVRSVIGTNYHERVLRPLFGSLVPSAFMETTDAAEALINSEVATAFGTYLPLLTLQSTDITYDEYTNEMQVTITYSLPDTTTEATTIAIITVDGANPASEENL